MSRAKLFLLLGIAACSSDPSQPADTDLAQLQAALVTVPSKTFVTIGFDDGRASQLPMLPELKSRGLKATFYLNSDRIGTSGFMTWSQVATVAADGHEIAAHTLGHTRLSGLTFDQDVHFICDDVAKLRSEGYPAVSFAFPFGSNDATSERAAATCTDSARDIGGIVLPGECSGCPFAETLPPRDLLAIRTPSSMTNCPSAQFMEDVVERAISAGGGWVHIVLHNIVDSSSGCGAFIVERSVLNDFLDYLVDRQDEGVVQVNPQLDMVAAKNPSFERVGSNGVSDCWERVVYLHNTGSFSRATFGHSGSAAERIEVTSLVDGNRKLLMDRTRSSCVIPARAGHMYRLSAWYQHKRYDTTTNSKVRFILYIKSKSTGTWKMLADSGSFPSTSSWKQMAWDSPPVPEDAAALSGGIYLKSLGLTTVDDFMLTDLGSP